MRSRATPGWSPLAVVVRGCLPPWLWSWLRYPATPGLGPPAVAVAVSVGLGGGFLVVCVFVAWCVRAWCLCWCVCRVIVVVAWVLVCLPCVLVCVCVCVWVCGWGQLGFAAGVGVGVVGVRRGWSLATPGILLPLLAGFRCRWWWVLLATPG